MGIEELRATLHAEGYSPLDYRICEPPAESTLCLEKQGKQWLVYHFERGRRFELQRFASEAEACEEFLLRARGLK